MYLNIIMPISLYLLLTTFLGIRAHFKSKPSADDYFVAERSVSWFHLGLTLFASWFSTLAFIAVAGFNYSRGVEWYFAQGTFWMLAPLAVWILGRRIWLLGKQHGYITPGDLLDDRYNSTLLRRLCGAISIFALLPYIMVQMVGIGKVLEVSTNGAISFPLGVMIAAVATALYTVLGGVRAIIWTDIIQGLLFLGVALLAVAVAANASDGLIAGLQMSQQLRPELFELKPERIGAPLTIILIWTPGMVLLPHLWQRNYMANSETAITKGICAFSLLSFVMLIATMLIGSLAIASVPTLADSDKIVPVLFQQQNPQLLPLLVLATFAAGMSTIDSQLLTASSIVIRDLFPSLRKKTDFKRREKAVGRLVVIVLIVLIAILALLPASQGAIFTMASKGTAASFLLLVPLLGAFARNQRNAPAAAASLLTGVFVLGVFELGLLDLPLPLGFGSPLPAFIAELLVFLAISKTQLPRKTKGSGQNSSSKNDNEWPQSATAALRSSNKTAH